MPVFLAEIAEKFLCNVGLHLSILFTEVAEEFEHLLSFYKASISFNWLRRNTKAQFEVVKVVERE